MYIVRKYARFLSKYPSFLRTVIREIFDFIHNESVYMKKIGISTLCEIFSDKKCCDVCLTQKDDDSTFWDCLMRNCRNLWMLDQEHKDTLYSMVVGIISHEKNGCKAEQYLADLNRVFCRFPKNILLDEKLNVIQEKYPSVPTKYICFKCKTLGKHWIMECNN